MEEVLGVWTPGSEGGGSGGLDPGSDRGGSEGLDSWVLVRKTVSSHFSSPPLVFPHHLLPPLSLVHYSSLSHLLHPCLHSFKGTSGQAWGLLLELGANLDSGNLFPYRDTVISGLKWLQRQEI